MDDSDLARIFRSLERTIAEVSATLRDSTTRPRPRSAAGGADRDEANRQRASKKSTDLLMELGSSSSSVGRNFVLLSGKTTILYNAFTDLVGIVRTVGDDYFRLQARGISATQTLYDMYFAAAKAGLSLEEYAKLLDESGTVVSRSSSMEAFNKRLEYSTKALGELGVFGPAARQFSATMMTTATAVGIPQAAMNNVMDQQISAFTQLRKVTGITADGFMELTRGVMENEHVQAQLLGLAPRERVARQQQLIQTGILGRQLGMTAQQSQQLTEALLAQRGASVEDRFKAMGMARMAGAMTGMNAADTEELALLFMKKNRTPDEDRRFLALGGQLEQRIQSMQGTNNLAIQYMMDQVISQMTALQRQQLESSGKARAAQESGPMINTDFGSQVGVFGQWVGHFATAVQGFQKSPLYQIIQAALPLLGGIATFMLLKKFGKGAATAGGAGGDRAGILKSAMDMNSKLSGMLFKPFTLVLDAVKGIPSGLKSVGTGVSGFIDVISTAGGKLKTFIESGALRTAFTSLLQGIKNIGSAVASGGSGIVAYARNLMNISSTFGKSTAVLSFADDVYKVAAAGFSKVAGVFKAGGPLSFIFSAIEEAFTGEMASALGLGDGIFGRILGVVIGGFNGIFTGITRLVDGALNWLLEGLGIDFTVNTTKLVDMATSTLTDFFKRLISVIMKGIAWGLEKVGGLFGVSPPFAKALKEKAATIDDSIIKSSELRQKMLETEGATLRTIGKAEQKQKEQAKNQAKKANQEISQATSSVQSTAVDSIKKAWETVGTQIAIPSDTVSNLQRPKAPEVNKNEEKTEPKPVQTTGSKAIQTSELDSNNAIPLLQEQLIIMKQQLAVLEQMLKVEPPRKVAFMDNNELTVRRYQPLAAIPAA
jgi:hypothetical protein